MKQIDCPESLNQLMRNYIKSKKNSYYGNDRGLRLELKIDTDSPCLTFVIKLY